MCERSFVLCRCLDACIKAYFISTPLFPGCIVPSNKSSVWKSHYGRCAECTTSTCGQNHDRPRLVGDTQVYCDGRVPEISCCSALHQESPAPQNSERRRAEGECCYPHFGGLFVVASNTSTQAHAHTHTRTHTHTHTRTHTRTHTHTHPEICPF